jgi:Cu2+-exporting ATPase
MHDHPHHQNPQAVSQTPPHDGHPGEHREHDKHAGHSVAMFRDKFWLSLALTIPTLLWGHMLPRVLGYAPPLFRARF